MTTANETITGRDGFIMGHALGAALFEMRNRPANLRTPSDEADLIAIVVETGKTNLAVAGLSMAYRRARDVGSRLYVDEPESHEVAGFVAEVLAERYDHRAGSEATRLLFEWRIAGLAVDFI